jgi:hypothetical protein
VGSRTGLNSSQKEKNILSLPGIEAQFVVCPDRRLVTAHSVQCECFMETAEICAAQNTKVTCPECYIQRLGS